MAWELPLLQVSGPAAEDLTADQFKFVGAQRRRHVSARPDNETEICAGSCKTPP